MAAVAEEKNWWATLEKAMGEEEKTPKREKSSSEENNTGACQLGLEKGARFLALTTHLPPGKAALDEERALLKKKMRDSQAEINRKAREAENGAFPLTGFLLADPKNMCKD